MSKRPHVAYRTKLPFFFYNSANIRKLISPKSRPQQEVKNRSLKKNHSIYYSCSEDTFESKYIYLSSEQSIHNADNNNKKRKYMFPTVITVNHDISN